MTTNERIMVKIYSAQGVIPFIQGTGPFLKPVSLLRSEFDILKKMGYSVEEVSGMSLQPIQPPIPKKSKVEQTTPEIKVEQTTPVESDVVVTEDEVNEVIEEAFEEEVISEEILEDGSEEELEEEVYEILQDDPDLSGDSFYTETFLEALTKAQCKSILDLRAIEYGDKANLSVLRKLVLETNPE
jgi:hypothetical protein